MGMFDSADWVAKKLDSSQVLVLDPRSAVQYLQGHLKNAVNVPLSKAFDAQGKLLSVGELARLLGPVGLNDRKIPVVYDSQDGRRGAVLAWILLYLGRADVHLMDIFLEGWIAEGREIFYRPVKPLTQDFSASVNSAVRAMLTDVAGASALKLVDFRSQDEYTGSVDTEGKPGHIPGAVNIVWQDLLGENNRFLASREKLERLLGAAGITPRDRVVAYCGTGLRAAVGYLALKELGFDVRLYDGSYREWARTDFPVEASQVKE